MELVDRQLQRAAGPLKENIVAAMKILQTNHRLAKEKTQHAERQKRLAEDDYMLAQIELADAEEYAEATLLKYERMMNEDVMKNNQVEAEATVEEKTEGEVKENPTSIEELEELMNEHLHMSDGLTKEIARAEIEALSSQRKLLKERCIEAEEDMERAGRLFEEALPVKIGKPIG
ncbi:uncharacterized protein LOC125199192 [Salvia hispanica]|uniref:uncharacterized protein LOC125199192 n=1 Tax=Salvia hispanica TaxID=49212 RepID=UPI002009D6CF|nr:uncharacterized protein LOC125199192 [Salvia hispanica]